MPYIGNDIQFGELTSQSFTGDGSTTAFTLSYTVANPTSLIVTIADVIQEPTTAYTVAGTTLTCTSAPANDDTIHVRYLGRVVDVANAAILQDSDQDTKIQVEESADEDTIRFDIAGAEDFTMTANTFTASSGSTIAAQALTATTIGSSAGITITGTTPTLTIGDAGAEDTKIVFDGNAQDYYIGLDDGTDDLLIGLGNAVGTTPAISIDENLAITTAGDITMGGTTPTLTIGDAGAEDTKIVFDGNALDYRIGLDDGTDTLEIGKGNAHGTTAHIITDTNGIVRMPLQCSFGVRLGASVSNVTGDNTRYTIPLNNAEWDVNSDFDLTNNKFVAPVDGTYCFNAGIAADGLTTSHTMLDAFFYDQSDNWYQYSLNAANVRNNNEDIYMPLVATIKMSAGTEVILQLQVYNGAKVVDIWGASYPFTWMTGFLVG